MFSRRESHNHFRVQLNASRASFARHDSIVSDRMSNAEPHSDLEIEQARKAMGHFSFAGRTEPFNQNDEIFTRSEPVKPWEVASNLVCPACGASVRKGERTFCRFCGHRCCRTCVVRKQPLPCRKEQREAICELCCRKFHILLLREEYQLRL